MALTGTCQERFLAGMIIEILQGWKDSGNAKSLGVLRNRIKFTLCARIKLTLCADSGGEEINPGCFWAMITKLDGCGMASATSVWASCKNHICETHQTCSSVEHVITITLIWAEKSTALCYSAAFYRLAFGWFCGRHAWSSGACFTHQRRWKTRQWLSSVLPRPAPTSAPKSKRTASCTTDSAWSARGKSCRQDLASSNPEMR